MNIVCNNNHHKKSIEASSFLLAAFLALVLFLNREHLLVACCCVFFDGSHCKAFVGEGLDLLFIAWGDRAEVVDSLIAQERIGLLFEFGPNELPLARLVHELDVHLLRHYLLPYF